MIGLSKALMLKRVIIPLYAERRKAIATIAIAWVRVRFHS